MDLFRFTNPTAHTMMREGELIQNTLSITWIERYASAGEFTITAQASSGIREKLPIGSFISHVDSTDIMIVENHEINDSKDSAPVVTITGRSFETFLENRIVGSNQHFPRTGALVDYVLTGNHPAAQAVILIRDHIFRSHLIDDRNWLPYFQVTSMNHGTGPSEQRIVQRGDVYARLLEILAVSNLGIKTMRPGPWLPDGIDRGASAFVIYKGIDKSADVRVSYISGEVDSADYLWSGKKNKNCALVSGRWVELMIESYSSGFSRRMMFVDASDIDQAQETAPTGLARDYIVAAMIARGKQALAAQNDVVLVKADVSHGIKKAIFRKDYDLGDLIMVSGDFNETAKMRVSEYVEIQDESGSSGYPTLVPPTGDKSGTLVTS